jgi:hypothetical protein
MPRLKSADGFTNIIVETLSRTGGRFFERLLRQIIRVTGGKDWWLDGLTVDMQGDGDESPREMFTDALTVALRNSCETDEERAFLRFAVNLGGRIGDMIRLRASDFNHQKNNIRYLNTKTGKMCGTWLWPENQEYVELVMNSTKEKNPA